MSMLVFWVALLLLARSASCADFTILGGNESKDVGGAPGAWQFHKFYPNNLTINAGDRIRFRTNDLEGHVVVFSDTIHQFAAPDGAGGLLLSNLSFPTGGNIVNGSYEVSSGRLFKTIPSPYPYEWYATFPQPGVFNYYCLFHPFTMVGTVNVNPVEADYERTPAEVDAAVAAEIASDLALTEGLAEKNDLVGNVTSVKNPDSEGTIYQIVVGWGNIVTASAFMRFSPQSRFTIQVGDIVNFTQGSMHTPHGVAFNDSGSFTDLEKDQFIMGKDTIVSEYVTPTGNPNYDGGFVSAGVFFPLDANTGLSSFAIKFLKPGVYPFMCPYHSFTGMVGQITVCDGDDCGGSGIGDSNSATVASYSAFVTAIIMLFVFLW